MHEVEYTDYEGGGSLKTDAEPSVEQATKIESMMSFNCSFSFKYKFLAASFCLHNSLKS